MNPFHKTLFATSVIVLAPLSMWAVGCADSQDGGDSPDGPNTSIGEAGVDGGSDALADADIGCDAAASDCVTHEISCDEADWCSIGSPVSTQSVLTAVWGSSANDVWAVGSGGAIAHFDGQHWRQTPTPENLGITFHGVWGSGPNDVWIVGMADTILHMTGFENDAPKWTRAPAVSTEWQETDGRAATAVWGVGTDELRVGVVPLGYSDENGVWYVNQYRRQADSDPAWGPVDGLGRIHGYWGTSAEDFWYVADASDNNGWQRGATIHVTKGPSGKIGWASIDSQATVTLNGIWGNAATGDIWTVGDTGAIRHFAKDATRWEIVASPTHFALNGVWGTSANDVWAVGDSGTVLHFDGTAWKASTVAYPTGKKANLRGIWGSGPNDVWIVGDGILHRYTGPKPAAGGNAP